MLVGEEVLPQDAPAAAPVAAAVVPDPSIVAAIESMGFSANAGKRAVCECAHGRTCACFWAGSLLCDVCRFAPVTPCIATRRWRSETATLVQPQTGS